MNISRVVAVIALVACGTPSEDDLDPDLENDLDIVARAAPVIRAVRTDDGFTEIRQNAVTSLVIRGRRLGKTTSVSVGSFFVTLDSVSPHAVRATVNTGGASVFGPIDVALTSARGTTIKPGALTVTPFVVSPTAASGHGTFQSPLNLCDPDLDLTSTGCIVVLLAGTHHCDHVITMAPGTTVQGDPDATTIVTGTGSGGFGMSTFGGSPSAITTVRDLTFADPLAETSIDVDTGGLVVERVVDAGGIRALGDGLASFDHYTYEGEGLGLDLRFAVITSSTIRHCGAGHGIHVGTGLLSPNSSSGATLDGVVVEGCAGGIAIGAPGADDSTGAAINNSQFIDNGFGISISDGFITMSNVVIRDDEATSQSSQIGISVTSGFLSAADLEITGQAETGIVISQTSSTGHAALFGDRLLISGGKIGISFDGIDNQLTVNNSIVRDQTQASVYISSIDSSVDLEHNTLSAVSGFVIDDDRHFNSSFSSYIRAAATTLNGVSFDDQTIDGPAELAPYYRFLYLDAGIRF